ncbi:hypothetical protein V8G54_007705, partial [Vigna mungo]
MSAMALEVASDKVREEKNSELMIPHESLVFTSVSSFSSSSASSVCVRVLPIFASFFSSCLFSLLFGLFLLRSFFLLILVWFSCSGELVSLSSASAMVASATFAPSSVLRQPNEETTFS